jgi:hypothetical protein
VKIERHYYTPAQLQKMKSAGWTNIDEAIATAKKSKQANATGLDKQNKTPGSYVEVWEVHGDLPTCYLAGTSDKYAADYGSDGEYEQQMHVVVLDESDKEKVDGTTLFRNYGDSLPNKLGCVVSASFRGFGPRLCGASGRASWLSGPFSQTYEPTSRPVVSAGSTPGKTGALVERLVDKRGKPADALQHRSNGHDAIVAAAKMRAHARPRPVPGSLDQASAHRIERDMADGGEQMLLRRHQAEPRLPEISGPAVARIDVSGGAPVQIAEPALQPLFVLRRHDSVHMVRHQTIDPDLNAGLGRRDAEPIPIIGIAEERPLEMIAALRNVVRNSGDGQARYPSHDRALPK